MIGGYGGSGRRWRKGTGRITDKNLIFRVHSLDLRDSFESSSNHHVPIVGCPKVRRHINNMDRAGKKVGYVGVVDGTLKSF